MSCSKRPHCGRGFAASSLVIGCCTVRQTKIHFGTYFRIFLSRLLHFFEFNIFFMAWRCGVLLLHWPESQRKQKTLLLRGSYVAWCPRLKMFGFIGFLTDIRFASRAFTLITSSISPPPSFFCWCSSRAYAYKRTRFKKPFSSQQTHWLNDMSIVHKAAKQMVKWSCLQNYNWHQKKRAPDENTSIVFQHVSSVIDIIWIVHVWRVPPSVISSVAR